MHTTEKGKMHYQKNNFISTVLSLYVQGDVFLCVFFLTGLCLLTCFLYFIIQWSTVKLENVFLKLMVFGLLVGRCGSAAGSQL